MNPFTKEDAARIFEETKGTRWHALIVLAITTGARQGELFGLEWSSVDLVAGKMTIRQAAAEVQGQISIRTTKTEAGIRTVQLTPRAVEALQTHRAILLREGNAESRFAFPAPKGGLIHRTTFRRRYWLPLLDRLQLARRGFHHTRHTYATLALGAGIPVHVVAQMMGHAKPSTTLDVYTHVLQTHQSAATQVMQRLFE